MQGEKCKGSSPAGRRERFTRARLTERPGQVAFERISLRATRRGALEGHFDFRMAAVLPD
jgi:hypothetical protein